MADMGLDFKRIGLIPPYSSWLAQGLKYLWGVKDPRQESPCSCSNSFSDQELDCNELCKQIYSRLVEPFPNQVWTYFELCLDYTEQASNERKCLFKKICKNLGLTNKDCLFLPMSLIKDGTLVPCPDVFWEWVGSLRPKYLFCFGKRAGNSLFSKVEKEDLQFEWQNCQVLILPGPEKMLPDNREAKNLVWKRLAKIFLG